ncbi:nuclear pore complex protein NUP133 isoform X3 [Dendrobium catenatum]|uniref:nuclear pore complex protein NUP133 isoform X3 n=1 Tax=Dendrobium catenatum TaxID=906689 RepID=UPI0009F256BC|nr:nuclear pore complex protein NUP133 isoform X3 [Dendrobium catenatum]
MFSPATRKSSLLRQKDRNQWGHAASAPPVSSPSTPLPLEQASGFLLTPSIPNRPTTGTPAPWATRPSVAVRIPTTKDLEKGTDVDQTKPVYVGDFPCHLRDAQEELLHEVSSGDKLFTGGMDKGTGLCWIICGNKLYIWSYLSASVSNKCVILEIPSSVLEISDGNRKGKHFNHWMVCIVRWDAVSAKTEKVLRHCNSAGVIICHMKTQALVYWPDIFAESRNMPVFSLPTPLDVSETNFHNEGRKDANEHQEICLVGSVHLSEHHHINSIIAAPVSGSSKECIAIACQSSGKLWHFYFTPSGIYRKKIRHDIFGAGCVSHSQTNKRYARSLNWHLQPHACSEKSGWQFFLLTDREIQYWNVMLTPEVNVTKLWVNEIVGNDGDLGIKKDLAGQKHIWLLDMQVDERGKEISILVATFCKDRLGGSSYTQYSLLTMICKAGKNINTENSAAMSARVLEKKAPLQVIIPKARVEDEEFLFSMRLRVGGKPSGSAIILSGDGTATVTNYLRGSIRLYQFDLPYDAGKVLDASVFPSAEDDEEGAWVVLTEKVGVWAIPEKAVLLGGVEPPERSLSRKGSCNEGITQEEKRIQAFGGNMAPRRASSEAWSSGDRPRSVITGIVQRTAQDEEAEVLLGRLFCDFMISTEVEGAFEKLSFKGAFEKEGETNVFARMSKSIVDTLAKHWTTTRGAELVASAIVSSLLLDKQQKHQKYLHFLALSRCHDELSLKQRHALLTIMEHGEKLSSIIQLRELQNMISQNRSNNADTLPSQSENRLGGSLWDLIQLVGDKARRNTVMLMDRDNAEVFYSKVSDIEEFFDCLTHHITYIIGEDQPYNIQLQRAYEISNACSILIQAAMQYRIENQTWYPSPEGLIPWNCQPVVRAGLWCIASFIMKLFKESALIDSSRKPDLWSQLEVLTDILLEAYTCSITARIECGEEHRGLVQEYSRKRDELLDSLLELTKRFADANYQDKCKGVEDLEVKEDIFREVSLPLLAIAKRHEGYPTLWHICYHLNDSGLLRNLMHDSRGPKGGFSNFVFEQLIKNHQFAKLLRLGEEFRDELASFLKDHNDLLWLHEIYLSQFSSASETLHALALSQDDSSALIEEQEFVHFRMPSSTSDRRRLLNLSKIAVAAGKKEGFELKMLRIEADLHILMLQVPIKKRFWQVSPRIKENQT